MNNKIISKKGLDIINFYKEKVEKGEEFNRTLNNEDLGLPHGLKIINEPFSIIPLLVNEDISEKCNLLSLKIPELMTRLPKLKFNNNEKEIADFYFDGDLLKAQMLLSTDYKDYIVNSRLDMYFDNENFKILEINSGCIAAGWEPSLFKYMFNIKTYEDEEYEHKSAYLIYLKYILENSLKNKKSNGDTINIFISVRKDLKFDISLIEEKVFNPFAEKMGLKCKLMSDIYNNTNEKNGNLFYKDTQIDTILWMEEMNVPDSFYILQNKKVFYSPTSLWNIIIANKSALALARKEAENGSFSNEENELVLNSVLWGEKLIKNKKVIYDNKKYDLIELIKNNKDNFILKPTNGWQGDDVYINRYINQKDFEIILNNSLNSNIDFIVQEYIEPSPINFISGKKFKDHDIVWGAISYGEYYAGIYVRMKELNDSYDGVINVSEGAFEANVYERIKKD
jgi:hypothetical protein